jgi:hypothetical protein
VHDRTPSRSDGTAHGNLGCNAGRQSLNQVNHPAWGKVGDFVRHRIGGRFRPIAPNDTLTRQKASNVARKERSGDGEAWMGIIRILALAVN